MLTISDFSFCRIIHYASSISHLTTLFCIEVSSIESYSTFIGDFIYFNTILECSDYFSFNHLVIINESRRSIEFHQILELGTISDNSLSSTSLSSSFFLFSQEFLISFFIYFLAFICYDFLCQFKWESVSIRKLECIFSRKSVSILG